jgi:hypothetical protein
MSSQIENQLRKVKQETIEDIQQAEHSIRRCEETIERLKTSKPGYNPRVVIERYTNELKQFQDKLSVLQVRLDKIEEGQYEDELREEMERNKKIIQDKSTATRKRKQDEKNKKITDLRKNQNTTTQPQTTGSTGGSNRYSGRSRYSGHYERNIEREMDQGERYYLKDCASVPDYLRDKLKNMPNNIGYIWKDIWCFGKLSPTHNKNEITLYEKRNSQFLVHQYGPHYYSLFEKDNAGRKHLISKHPIRRLTNYPIHSIH